MKRRSRDVSAKSVDGRRPRELSDVVKRLGQRVQSESERSGRSMVEHYSVEVAVKQWPQTLTLRQAAEYLQLHIETVRRLAIRGEVPGAKVAGRWRFSRKALDAMCSRRADASGRR